MAASWTLAEIRKKVRQVSGRLSTNLHFLLKSN